MGAGLLIQPTGQAVLARLGVLDRALALGHRILRLDGRTKSGRRVLDIGYADLDPGLFGLGMHRGALFTLLVDAARGCDSVEIRTGVSVSGVQREGATASVVDAAGGRHGPFDLVIIADGAKSRLASGLGARRWSQAYPYAALWFVTELRDPALHSTLWQVYRGTSGMIGMLPCGRAGQDGARETVSVFWSLRAEGFDALKVRGIESWKAAAVALDPRVEPLLESVRSFDDVVLATYTDSRMRPVHAGRVVALGDAAHAMSPQLGQGANLALVDAASLVDCLAAAPSVEEALALHERGRRAHTRFYAYASRWLTPWFQSDMEILAWPRDLLLEPMSRVGWIRREMVRSLAGVKDGVVSHRALAEVGRRGRADTSTFKG